VKGVQVYLCKIRFLKKKLTPEKSRGLNTKKIDYFLFMEVITRRAITDATMVITGGNGDFVVVGTGFDIVVVAAG
jgi:hypothetical protein